MGSRVLQLLQKNLWAGLELNPSVGVSPVQKCQELQIGLSHGTYRTAV